MARSPDPAGQDRPWPRWYAERRLGPLAAHPDLVTMAAAAVEAAPHQVALTYYGWMATHAELARLSDGFAAYLASRGVQRGDRVAVCLQTSPHFVVAALGAWKVGAILVTVNPMYREGEVAHLLSDSGAVAVVSSQRGYRTVVAPVLAGTTVRVSVTTSEVDVIDDPDPRVFAGLTDQAVDGTDDLMTVARGHADEGFTAYRPAPGDVAVLCYTSGTTGPAKGAAHPREHRHDDRAERAVAGHAAWLGHLRHRPALPRRRAGAAGGPHAAPRRDPRAALPDRPRGHARAPRRVSAPVRRVPAHRVHSAHGRAERDTPEAFASLDLLYAGGAVLPPAVVERFLERFGKYVNNGYGLTETAGACVFAIPGRRARMDEASQALSNGVPLPGMDVRIVGDDGQDLSIGERGEIVVKGPCVTPGYWQNPTETANAIHNGWFVTGDIGFIDDEGMLYCVDRKKDMIVASGFKVWPGEVEQVLLTHPAVMEAAVVGMPDSYRGESVKAFVIPRPGSQASPEELAAWCKARLATFKAPREVQIVADLPRTASGKILKRELR